MLSMKRIATVAVIACLAGAGTAVATTIPATTHSIKLAVKTTRLGKILVTNGGLIVYIFTKDRRNLDRCPVSTGCAAQWPPLVGTPSLGVGVRSSLIGHIRVGSKEQITYDGHPLYGYRYNSTSVSYVGYVQFGGAWDAIAPAGSIVRFK